MSSDNGSVEVTEMEPDLQHARRTSVMAHTVLIKFKEMGLPQDMDDDLASLCTDLGDMWGAQKEFTDRMNNMLKSAKDWESLGDYLVDLRSSIDHIAWHLKSVRRPLTRITQYAYKQEGNTAE